MNDDEVMKFAAESMQTAMAEAKAHAFEAEERAAWDRYAAAALAVELVSDDGDDGAGGVAVDGAAMVADAMLAARRERFGGGA